MLYVFPFLIALVSIHPLKGDIPDNVLDSGVYEVIKHIGDDHLIDVTFSEEDSVTSCFGFSVSALSETSITTGGLSARYGNVMSGVVNLITRVGQFQTRIGRLLG